MTNPAADRPSGFPWPPVLLVLAVGLALALDRLVLPLPVPFAEVGLVHDLGATLLMAGLVLVVWASFQFPRHKTSIRPDRGSSALVAAGPFAFSRNPNYLGETVAMIGAGISFNSLWLVLAAPMFAVAVTRLAIVPEEAYLARRFGADYLDYRARVRRWL
ncbi:MAG: isoprenylcysteine carboxylmethyltransferase family protein [Hyphomicrobiaceae bacterium]